MSDSPTIFFCAAEASGDAHAAELITALKRRLPGARIIGAGGQRMADAGCEVAIEMVSQATMLHGPFLKIGYYRRCLRQMKQIMDETSPAVVVPVDSPALNWHVARAAKQRGIGVMYYIAPQVWAWATHRVGKLARLTDHVACILPFEQDYLRARGVNATFVGHPLFDHAAPRPASLPDLAEASQTGRWRVALLPGSRAGEIADHASAMAAVADAIAQRWPEAVCTFAAPDETAAQRIADAVGDSSVKIVAGQTPKVLADSHMAVVTSGTATLLTAHYGVPMVVVYKLAWLTYQLVGRWILRTQFLSLVNILADREIVPELMPWFGSVGKLVDAVLAQMTDLEKLTTARRDVLAVSASLEGGAKPACEATADLVIDLIQRRGG
ncbi:hypothetical protein LCGC14_0095700 [marine sediment metagenome]|uniref:lipid-A-disaccharide synthase n=1 Tax=marine sediment metagenome TaxID=412755 RepID=A0A0F9XW76_9ZZZZ|nr:lipid-A-disaccharide synthase [Phycisphaerae bacterium]HDZ44151.1 lipid-A-disaccharide synthase [Phycisphaerae bacterium]